MNILSISQVQPQAQTDLKILPIQTEKSSEMEKPSSFADFLRDARKVNDNAEHAKSEPTPEEKVGETESEKLSKNSEESDFEMSSAEKPLKTNKKDEKSEKIVQKNSSENKKIEGKTKKLANLDKTGEKIPSANLNLLQNSKNANFVENKANLGEKFEISALDSKEDTKIDEKTLAWLTSQMEIDESEEISSEDFAKLIDAAVEFIPGSESESEKLESAQNLSTNDPEFFLSVLENSDLESVAALNQNGEKFLPPDSDKRIPQNSKEKKNDVKFSVHDLRTQRFSESDSAKIASDKIVQKSAEKKEINLSMQKQADGNIQMTMELAARAEQNITSSSAQAAGAEGSNFQAMLSNAVQENAPDFVKAGNIVLKDGNQGSINLVLRPEGLGNVKISLNLDDKNLSAQIVVHTKEAMDAFRESIPSLKQAFTESGFETGSFDLNFSDNGANQQGFAQGEQQNQHHAGILAHRTYGDFVTPEAFAQENASAYSGSEYGINIVA